MRKPVLTFSFFSSPPTLNSIKTNINMNPKMAATNKNSFWKLRVSIAENKTIEMKKSNIRWFLLFLLYFSFPGPFLEQAA